MRFRKTWLICLSAVGLVAAAVLAGCSPSYVARAAYEETRLLWRRQTIEKVLVDSELNPSERTKLGMVIEARKFAEDYVGLKVGGSFSTVSKVHDGSVINVLAAAKHDRLEPYTWWFPVVGKVPYKGFFDKKEAKQAAESLEGEGYDTYVRPALAFSTLGWFDDPLPSVLLERDTITLVQTVFHELFHRTLFVPGEMAFNESAANFAGDRAAIEFFCAEGSQREEECREATGDWKDTLTVARFLEAALLELREFYDTSPGEADLEKGRIREFAAIRERFKSLELHGRYAGFVSGTLNNASLLESRMYYRDLDLFDELYRIKGNVRESVRALKAGLKKAGKDPFDGLREALKAGQLEVARTGSVGRP